MNHLILKYRNNIDIVKLTAQRLKYSCTGSVLDGAAVSQTTNTVWNKVCIHFGKTTIFAAIPVDGQ